MIVVGIVGTIMVWGMHFYLYMPPTTGTVMRVNGTNFSVNYTITNATILSMVNDSHNVITINLQTKGDGYAVMTMPRSVLEHRTPDAIEGFGLFVAVTKSDEIRYNVDKKTLTDMTFSFPFKKGDDRIIMWLPNHKY